MVTRNKLALSIIIILGLTAARNDSQPTQSFAVYPCQNPKYTAHQWFPKQLTGRLVKRHWSQHQTDLGLYFISCPAISHKLELLPCNLPKEAFVEGLHVRLTGKVINYPGIEPSKLTSLPFELTSLQAKTN